MPQPAFPILDLPLDIGNQPMSVTNIAGKGLCYLCLLKGQLCNDIHRTFELMGMPPQQAVEPMLDPEAHAATKIQPRRVRLAAIDLRTQFVNSLRDRFQALGELCGACRSDT